MSIEKNIENFLFPNHSNENRSELVGLFFGSFNPIHNGHMIIANYMLEFTEINKIFFVVSPQNPFKKQENLLEDYHRLAIVNEVIGDSYKYIASDIEFKMPRPSYTIDTLTYLKEKYPTKEFSLIMGSDNLKNFHKWKNAERILEEHKLYVYPRPGFDVDKYKDNPNVINTVAPLMEISSTFIRQSIKEEKDIRYFMPEKAWKYIREMHFYEK
jgi:nicotinate-nucleotide adenylyltransferase